MRFPFGRSPRRRELEEILKRLIQLREEISRLEQTAEELPEETDTSDAYRSVQRLRGSMAREELVTKRAELRQLEARAFELESELAVRPTGNLPDHLPEAPNGERTQEIETSPEPSADRELPAARAIIEPALPADTAVREAITQPVTVTDEATPDPGQAAAQTEPVAERVEVLEAESPAPPPRRRTGVFAALAVLGLLILGAAGGIAAGYIPLEVSPARSPTAQSPLAIAPTVSVPATRPPSPTAVPPTPTSVPPTSVPPTAAPTEEEAPGLFPTEESPEIDPETSFEPNVEPAIASVVVLAPTGFTGAWLRTQPSMNSPVFRLLPNGTRVDLLPGTATGSGFRWSRVRTSDGLAGWVVAITVGD